MDIRMTFRDQLRTSLDWNTALDQIERELDALDDKAAQSESLFELAQLAESVCAERERPLALYQKAWKQHPENRKALRRARELYAELGRVDMVAKVGELELKQSPDDLVLAGYVGEALLDAGMVDKARGLLERAATAGDATDRVKDAWAALSYDKEFWSDEVERLVGEGDRPDATLAVRMLLRAVRIMRMEAPDDMRIGAIVERILELDPNEPSANYLQETILIGREDWRELEALHNRRLAATPEHDRAVLAQRIALQWLQRYKQRDVSARFFQLALRLAGANGSNPLSTTVGGLAFLKQLADESGDYADYLELADLLLPKLPSDAQLLVAEQAGVVAWRKADRPADAVRYFERAVNIDADSALAKAFANDPARGGGSAQGTTPPVMASGSTTDLPAAAEAPATAVAAPAVEVTPAAAEPVAVAAAPQVVQSSASPATTIEIGAGETMDDVPDDAKPLVDKAIAAASAPDKGVAAWKDAIVKFPSVMAIRRQFAQALAHGAMWPQLVDALKDEEAKAAKTSGDKARVWRELAEAYGKLGNETQAMLAMSTSLSHDPSQMGLYDQLEGIYENKKRWPDLVKLLGERAERATSDGEKVELHLRIANLYLERFSNQAEAIRAFEKVLETDPANQLAIEHLLAIYEKRREWEKLIKLKENEIMNAPYATRGAMVLEVARMANTKVKKPEICQYWWEKTLEFDASNEEALGELVKIYERNREWNKLAEALERQTELLTEDKARVDAYQRLGILYMEKIEGNDRAGHLAIDAWQKLLAIDENHRRAQDSLKKLYIGAGRWEELEAIFRDRGKLDEYVRTVLEREVESGPEEQRVTVGMRVAELYRDELGKPDRALRAFEKVLQLDPEHLGAAEALIPLFEGAKDYKRLVAVLEIQLAKTTEASTRVEQMRALAEHNEEKLRDKGAALAWWLKAHREARMDASIWEQLERLAKETGAFAELSEAYEETLRLEGNSRSTLPLLESQALLVERELGDLDRALVLNKSILEIEDANEAALDAMDRLLVAKGQFGDLKKVYERKLDLTSDLDGRIAILSKLGSLYETEVKDDDEAVKAYQSILDMSPDDRGTLSALDRLFLRAGKWNELAEILQRQLIIVGLEDDRTTHLELKRRLGEVRDTKLGQTAGAIENYRDILEAEPSHAQARAALEQKLDHPDHRVAVSAILEPIYEQNGEWLQLIGVQEIKLSAEQDGSTRAALLLRIGELYRTRLGNAEKAADAYGRCLQEEPGNEVAQQELEALADLLDDGWVRLAGLLEKALASDELDAVQTHQMALKLGDAYLQRLGKIDSAVEAYQKALSVEPDDERALGALESIFASQERYPELLEVYRRKADIVATDQERLEVLFKIAEIQEQMLGQRDEAITAYGEVLAQDADNLVALRALDRLFEGGERWQDLGDNLTRQLTIIEDDQARVPLLVRLAHLRETHLGEQAAAVETYRQVLDTDAANAPAISALERLGSQPEFELSVAGILEPLYRQQGDAAKQIGSLETVVKHSFDPVQKMALLHQIAELNEIVLGDMKAAFAAHARALAEDAQDATTLAQLERLSVALGDQNALVELYRNAAQAATDDEQRIALLYRAARVQEEAMGDAQAAVATLEQILEVDPSQEAAATRIQAIWEITGNWAGLVDILRRRSDVTETTGAKREYLYRAAHIEEEVLNNEDAAIATYQHVLSIDDADDTALTALERLYIRLERWNVLKDVYAKRADLAADPAEKKRTLYVLGQVYDRELSNTPKAIETYQQILDVDADEVPAIQALDRLLGQAERWYDLLGNLERQIELSQNAPEKVALTYRVGLLWQAHLGDTSRAIETYREALAIDPYHVETLAALDALLRGSAEPLAAAKVLEPVYEAAGEWGKLADVFEVMVGHSEDPVERVNLLHRLAQLQEYQLSNPDAAYKAYSRALADDRTNEQTIGHLERLSEQQAAWAQTGALYLAQAEAASDPSRQTDMLLRAARVYQQELGDLEAAISAYTRVLAIEPEERTSLEALDDLYSHTQRWAELVGVLRTRARLAPDETEAAVFQFRLGQTLEHALGDARAAIDVYRDILFATPTHAPTIAALESLFAGSQHQSEVIAILEPLYESAGEFEKLHTVYQAQLAAQVAPRDRQGMLQRLAELSETKLADAGRAFQWWAQALVEDPASELAAEQLERFAGDVGAWDHLAAVYQQAIDENANVDRAVMRDVLMRRGRVLEVEVNDVAGAVETYLRVLQQAPEDVEALAALDRLYLAAGMYEELVEVLRRRAALAEETEERNELLFRRGEIYTSVLGDLDAALGCYRQVLEQDSRNRRALEAEEHIHFRREEWSKLYATYEKLVDVAQGDDELAGVYARMARVASDALSQDDHAVDLWRRVADIKGEDADTLGAIAEIHERNQQWEPYVETLERQVAITPDELAQVELYKAMGRIWAGELQRPRNAIDAWLAADRINPVDGETLAALCELYRSTQAWDELSSSLRRLIAVSVESQTFTDEMLIAQYSQLGALEGDVLGRVDDAVEAWQQVLYIDPRNEAALTALESLYTREARWEGVIEILNQRAQIADHAEARTLHLLQAGSIWEEKVGNLAEAATVFERVHQEAPGNGMASERLEAIYRSQYRWAELVEVLLTRVDNTPDSAQQIALYHETARIYETELGDQESAFVVLQAAFKLNYADETNGRELERLAGATGKWAELLGEYTEHVRTLEHEDRAAAAELWVKIGRWYGEHLSHVEYAMHSVQEALRIDPAHPAALVALADLQRRRGMWRELQDTLNRHIAIEQDPSQRTELSLQLAELWEGQLQDPQQALYAYQQALAADPENRSALGSLERLYRRAEAWDALIDILYRRAAVENDPEEAVRVRLEIGQVYDQRLGAAQQAVEAYRSVLEIDAGNQFALRALEELYDKTNQPELYLDVLELQLDISPTDGERVALYARMAAAWEERFAKLDRAADCYEKIVAIDPRNLGAFRELERLYYQSGKWDALVETYRNHIPATADITARIDLYCAMGGLYESQLDNSDRAIEAYNEALTLRQDEPRALEALGRLYERIGDWHRAIEALGTYVRIVDDTRAQAELYTRMGKVLHLQIRDIEAAESHLLHALTLDPANAPAMEALVSMYQERGDWLKAAQMMVRAESSVLVATDKVRLLFGAATIYEQRLQQAEYAKQLYAAVIALDPEHVEAGRPLSRLYYEAQDWPQLSPVVDMLVRKLGGGGADPQELNELYYRAGRAADEIGDLRRAQTYYKAAYDIDPTYLPTLTSRADLLYKMQDWDGAGKLYQTLLVQQRDVTSPADVVRTYFRLGMVRQHLGERKKAHNMFEKALEIDATHRDTLLAMVALQEQQGEWEAVVHAKRGLLVTAEEKERVTLLTEIGGIYEQKLSNPQKAISSYIEALDISPNEHSLLQRMLELYVDTQQWKKAIETIVRFTAIEKDTVSRGQYFLAAASIFRDKLQSIDEAIDQYNAALDSFFEEPAKLSAQMLPKALKAFAEIDKLLTTKRAWKDQERSYRNMLKRIDKPGVDPGTYNKLRVDLLHALGEVYRSRLKHYQSAVGAFELAQQLDPDNAARAEILAELYLTAGTEYADKAVDQHVRMLQAEPFKYDSYKALYKIYTETQQYDKAWCISATLAFLKKTDPHELEFYEQYKPRGLAKATSAMNAESWARMVDDKENRYISAIFAAVYQGVAAMKAYPHKDLGIKRKDKRDVRTDQLMLSRALYYSAQALGVPLPEVFVLEDNKPAEIQLANFIEKTELCPAFVVRPQLFQGKSEKELAFASARRLTFMRPEYYLKLLLPTNTELKVALFSAIALVKRDIPVPTDVAPLVAQYLPEMQQRITPQMAEQLAHVVRSFLTNESNVNLAEWGQAAEAVSQRAGFVLCGDLEVAAKLISADPAAGGQNAAKERIKELILFSISENYFAVRKQMGITIG